MSAPLDDITIVELDSYMAAPSAGAILADLGATIIKVEPLGGDPLRGLSRPIKAADMPPAKRNYDFGFDVDNRGKQSIAVAIDQPAGAELVRALIAKADIFMCNLLVARQEKFGLDPTTLFKVKPNLVHATLTGYGTSGSDAWRPGYDVTAFFGRSGIYDAMREGENGPPPMARPAQGDATTGLAFAGAIMAALRMAERSGTGQVVETSLYETAVWTQATDYAVTANDLAPVRKRAREEMLAITANRFPCGDGKWVVFNMMPDSAYWSRMCAAIGIESLMEDDRFIDSSSRYRNMAALIELVDTALSHKTRDEWGVIFDQAGLIWGPVLGLHEVPQDQQAVDLGLFPSLQHPEFGEYRSVSIPMRFANADVRPRGPAPQIGQHSVEILQRAGYGEANIADLIQQGIVGSNQIT